MTRDRDTGNCRILLPGLATRLLTVCSYLCTRRTAALPFLSHIPLRTKSVHELTATSWSMKGLMSDRAPSAPTALELAPKSQIAGQSRYSPPAPISSHEGLMDSARHVIGFQFTSRNECAL